MIDHCVVFLYHQDVPYVHRNLNVLRRNNPGMPVFTVCNSAGVALEFGSIDVAPFLPYPDENKWHGCDQMIYAWLKTQNIEAERFVFFEQDTLCLMSVRDFYSEVWDADAVASHVVYGTDWWFEPQKELLNPKLRIVSRGMAPISGVMLSHRAAQAIRRMNYADLPHNIFSELRLGTMVSYLGMEILSLPPAKRLQVIPGPPPVTYDPAVPGIYHPVRD